MAIFAESPSESGYPLQILKQHLTALPANHKRREDIPAG